MKVPTSVPASGNLSSVQLLSCDQFFAIPLDWSMPGFPIHHQFPELAETHVHQVGEAIQSSHPVSSPSPPAFNLSQHQGLFQWSQFFTSGGQSIGASASASVLPMNIQDWFLFRLTDLISLKSKESRLLCCWLLLFVPVFAWNVCRVVSCVADSTQATGKAWDK